VGCWEAGGKSGIFLEAVELVARISPGGRDVSGGAARKLWRPVVIKGSLEANMLSGFLFFALLHNQYY
jgi:hypothetical protein